MGRFDGIRKRIATAESLSRLSGSDIDALRAEQPNLPGAYLEFLGEVGFGDLGGLCLYSDPTSAGSVYSPLPDHLRSILLIGDDMQGYCFGFDTGDGFRLVEITPTGTIESGFEPDFTGLLQGYFGGVVPDATDSEAGR
jgi:hypothetical protein